MANGKQLPEVDWGKSVYQLAIFAASCPTRKFFFAYFSEGYLRK